jgi:hypothetical protein
MVQEVKIWIAKKTDIAHGFWSLEAFFRVLTNFGLFRNFTFFGHFQTLVHGPPILWVIPFGNGPKTWNVKMG